MPAGSHPERRYPLALLAAYLAWWSFLAISPWYREDWLLENLLVFVGLPIAILVHRHLSRAALTGVFVFLVLHTLGAHYTYAEVPYNAWSEAAFGISINDLLGLDRNHFDRLVHLLYGLLVTPAFIQLLDAKLVMRGGWRYLIPFTFMASHSAIYEIIEWFAAEVFGGELGQAYLGTQGDVWDAQKDSALAVFGALFCVICYRRYEQRRR